MLTIILERGDVIVYDSGEAYRYDLPEGMDLIYLRVPKHTADEFFPDARHRRVPKMTLASNEGIVAGSLISSLAANCCAFDATRQSAIARHALGILGAIVDDGAGKHVRLGTPRQMLIERVLRYVDVNIGNEHLSPAVIAQAHGISHRYLNKIFEARGETAQRHILELRLKRCRGALCDDAWRGRSIGEIAYAHGFSNLSHFCRAFRAMYGESARAARLGGKTPL